MDTLAGMNAALSYIERNLAGQIDLREAARLAFCSEYHFRRLFSSLAGTTLTEYIRRRRLTLAALELLESDGRIIDIAVKYGYTAADSFTRAFAGVHGVTPSAARQGRKALTAYPRLSFQLTVRGGNEMKYRLVEKEAFRIVGIRRRVPIQFSGVNPAIAAMWGSLTEANIAQLKALSNVDPAGLIQASVNFSAGRMEEKGELDHYIGAATTGDCPAGMACLDVPAGTWAVFTAIGSFPAVLQETWGRIYSEWLPASGYEAAEGPEILWVEGQDTAKPDYRSEIWLPVLKKE